MSRPVSALVIIIIRHEVGLNRPILSSCLRPLGLQISTFFGMLLLFIFFTCRQLDLKLSFSSNGSTFNSPTLCLFFGGQK
jgi:hypothetical protein